MIIEMISKKMIIAALILFSSGSEVLVKVTWFDFFLALLKISANAE